MFMIQMHVYQKVIDLGEAVHIYNGRTLVPVRKIIETFGGKVISRGKNGYSIRWPSLDK